MTKPSNSVRAFRRRRSSTRTSNNKRKRISNSNRNNSVEDKLEALKNLIPGHHQNYAQKCEIKSDNLFKETADYIVLLRTQAFFLQKLIDFYGSSNSQIDQSGGTAIAPPPVQSAAST